MSILIRGMGMPNKKNGAVLIIYPDGKCAFEDGQTYQAIPAADVVPVVRCKFCRSQRWCKFAQYLGNDGFCSQGEYATNCLPKTAKCYFFEDEHDAFGNVGVCYGTREKEHCKCGGDFTKCDMPSDNERVRNAYKFEKKNRSENPNSLRGKDGDGHDR